MTESDTSILFDQYHSHLYLISHLSAFLDQKRSQEVQESKWSYSLDFGLKLLKRRKETLGKRFSGSCSERMVRAPFERGKTGGQRLNHEDCKVAGLQNKEVGPGKRPEQSIKEGMTPGLGLSRYALSQQSLTFNLSTSLVGERPSVQIKVCLEHASFVNVMKMLMSWRTERQILEGNRECSSFT